MEYIFKSSEDTIKFGEQISQKLETGDVISVYGDLGTGKTTLIKGICRGLGYKGIVSSPSFTLINEYNNSFKIYHFDFYRLKSPEEVYSLGVNEFFFGEGVCLIEWPDLAKIFLPEKAKNIFISYSEKNLKWRKIRVEF